MTSAVSVRGLSKTYGRLPAVRDLDLDVGYGEIFAILGPNGAGKTTTIEILEGHRNRDAGQVHVLGEDPGTAGRSWRARIGIVLQEASDFGLLTVLETMRMFAQCYAKARIPEELLEKEEWLREQFKVHKSVTELEILHGVLLNPQMAGHAYFYFRNVPPLPVYIHTQCGECAGRQ